MSDLATVYNTAIVPAYDTLPGRMSSVSATVMLLAIGLQESRLVHRRQIRGPARGLWQFERDGGVAGVLRHPSTREAARQVCVERAVPAVPGDVYHRLEIDDVLAAAFARLLLWTDAKPLPQLGDEATAWDYYIRNWRPGKPHPGTWPELYDRALRFGLSL